LADDAPSLLRRLAGAAWGGLKLLVVSVAALALAVVAAVSTIVGVAAKVVAEVLAQVAGLMREALPFLLSIVPVLARAGLVLGACASMVAAFPYLWDSYAGDTGSVLVGGAYERFESGLCNAIDKFERSFNWRLNNRRLTAL
jgi:hypothetical protein